jgi:hypothetical protein
VQTSAPQLSRRERAGLLLGDIALVIEAVFAARCIGLASRASEIKYDIGNMNHCPICGAETEELAITGDGKGFDCPLHGKFTVAGSVLGSDAFLNAIRPQWEVALTKAKSRAIPDVWPCITAPDFL